MNSNDNNLSGHSSSTSSGEVTATTSGDPHGQAALLLVESLIHGLCESEAFTPWQAVDVVERAVSVQRDIADADQEPGAAMQRAHDLLVAIATSLRTDLTTAVPPPRLLP